MHGSTVESPELGLENVRHGETECGWNASRERVGLVVVLVKDGHLVTAHVKSTDHHRRPMAFFEHVGIDPELLLLVGEFVLVQEDELRAEQSDPSPRGRPCCQARQNFDVGIKVDPQTVQGLGGQLVEEGQFFRKRSKHVLGGGDSLMVASPG